MLKRILSVFLICLLVFTCAGCGQSEGSVLLKSSPVTGYKAMGIKGSVEPSFDETLKKALENDYLALYYHKDTLSVTVFDKRTGKSYTTAPSEETLNKTNNHLATLNLIYSDSQGKNGAIDCYTQSVVLGQTEVKVKGNTLTFNYSVGDMKDGLEVTPSVLSNERFEYLLEKADEKQKKLLKRRYSFIKDDNTWSRRKITSAGAIADLIELFEDIGYTSEDLKKDNKENNVSAEAEEKLSFFVPLSFTLEEDSVVASVDLEKVTYPKKNPLIKIEFMQFFGATGADGSGYFLLPDGSGAIMPFCTVENGSEYYEAPVYGYDNALRKKVTAAEQKDVLMPIYGASYQDGGFLAVIEDGDALADIYACNSGATDNYNKVYSIVNVKKTESVSLGEQQASDNFNYYNFQKNGYKGNYSVRYIFLEKDKNDYSAMAAAYRNYLYNTKALSENKAQENAPFVLQTVGGILSKKQFLGFQYKGITALTEYADNIAMAEKLKELGVDNVSLRLTAFSGDGMQRLLPTKHKLIGELGGKSGFKKLLNSAKEKGIAVYPDVSFLTFSANSGIAAKNKYAMSSMDYKAASVEVINSATLLKNTQLTDNLYYLISLNKLNEVEKGVEKFLKKNDIENLSIADMASGISSDFSDKGSFDRQSAANTASSMIGTMAERYSLMLSAANAKNAACATLITEAPLWSSQYSFMEGVPFYSMVYHGSVDYTGDSLNLSSDSQNEFLRCVEYGASLKYTLVYRNGSAVKESDYTDLYAAEFESNKKTAADNYKAQNSLYKKTANAQITAHKKLNDSVYVTEYSNGVLTVVNYSDNDFVCSYGTVPAKDFIVKER